jgi:hypothetical protein
MKEGVERKKRRKEGWGKRIEYLLLLKNYQLHQHKFVGLNPII